MYNQKHRFNAGTILCINFSNNNLYGCYSYNAVVSPDDSKLDLQLRFILAGLQREENNTFKSSSLLFVAGIVDARNTATLAYRMMCDGCVMKITKSLSKGVKTSIIQLKI